MPRRCPPSPLKLVPVTPGVPAPRWPVYVVPSPPPPSFSAPVRTRTLSVGTGVLCARLPKLSDAPIEPTLRRASSPLSDTTAQKPRDASAS
ncbi:hypothetical protein JCM10212_002669 [Sporobolomyces blumeae]